MTGSSFMNPTCLFVLCCRCGWLLRVRNCPWGLLAAVPMVNLEAVVLKFLLACFYFLFGFRPLRCFVFAPWHSPSHTELGALFSRRGARNTTLRNQTTGDVLSILREGSHS